ncbi:helix-turn-helix domain-containing protein [Brevibacillus sp. JB24b]|uniref:helix-turn-helix domain-containing protein n=1 Tax=Brevibacillus sp. JB24b TaxID=3422308 RepID=UPI003F684024
MNRFKSRRLELGLSLEEVAKRAEISKAYLSQIENGVRGKRLNYPMLLRLANALETTPDELMKKT